VRHSEDFIGSLAKHSAANTIHLSGGGR